MRFATRVAVLAAVGAGIALPATASADVSCGDWRFDPQRVAVGEQVHYDVNARVGSFDFRIIWGEGNAFEDHVFAAGNSYRFFHTYSAAGTYTVSVIVSGSLDG